MIADELLEEIDAFLERTGMAHTRFGSEAMKDPSFVTRLRKNKNPTTKTVQKVRAFMERHQSADRVEVA